MADHLPTGHAGDLTNELEDVGVEVVNACHRRRAGGRGGGRRGSGRRPGVDRVVCSTRRSRSRAARAGALMGGLSSWSVMCCTMRQALALADVGTAMGGVGKPCPRKRWRTRVICVDRVDRVGGCDSDLSALADNRAPERCRRPRPELHRDGIRRLRLHPAGGGSAASGGDRRGRDPECAACAERVTVWVSLWRGFAKEMRSRHPAVFLADG